MNLPPRELEICQRLRAFRDAKQISRTKFALSVGIGSDRLASYEAGRVALRYSVFKVIAQRFHLNPYWLATGETSPDQGKPFDDSGLVPNHIKPNALFTEVYDAHLHAFLKRRTHDAGQSINSWIEQGREVLKNFNPDDWSQDELREMAAIFKRGIDAIEKLETFETKVRRRLRRKRS
jgi:transcriptional regulator with XRE-family HTH domain